MASKGRALLMPFLFSETDENDAPTRIRVGSHLDVAPLLAPYGEYGLTMVEISTRAIPATEHCSIAFATGRPGDVYLCHPLLVHAAQPPLDPVEPYDVDHGTSPVEQARAMSPGAG
ncbi:hypothetical protein [Streptomyces sp. NPDC001843]|uniref:hypothetical protein n=1 Tax=Streptomyces sp. NPDC001843 TaxID=3364617 RepID=UPI0036895A6B